MGRIAMVALVPVLSDLDARKSDRRLERDQAKRLGNAVGQIRRQRRNAVGLRRYNCGCVVSSTSAVCVVLRSSSKTLSTRNSRKLRSEYAILTISVIPISAWS